MSVRVVLAGFVVRLRTLVFRGREEREMEEELRFHLDAETARNVANGMSPTEASETARRAFGIPAQHQDAMRDALTWRWLEQLSQDVRFALRGFVRAPAFALTVMATIALALGLNTACFTIFNAYVLRPIQVRDPYSLYQYTYHDAHGHWRALTAGDFDQLRAFRRDAESFAFHFVFARVDGAPTFGALATGNVFQVLGVRAHLGRTLLPEDALPPTGSAVVVLSYDLWRSRFGADSGIVGRTIRIRGHPLTVVGVLPREFQGLGSLPPDLWAPLTLAARLETGSLSADPQVRAVIRLRPGESEAQAKASLGTWAARLFENEPDSVRGGSADLMSLANAMPSDESETYQMFVPIFIAFALVMLIACANVANMMLARALARQREIGIRLALGAERARLIRQLLAESVLLALPAAAAGFLLSRWAVDFGVRVMWASMPADFAPYVRVIPLAPDMRVFVFILAAAVASALFFGLVPALQATRPSIVQASRGDFDTAFRPGRLRGALVVAQITVCAVLLICTGVLLRTATRARAAETGLAHDGVVQLNIDERLREPVIQKLNTHAVVERLAAGLFAPIDGIFPAIPMRAAARPDINQACYDFVTANYFETLGIPLVAGRPFTIAEERAGAQVAVVSAAAAARLWPGTNPLGQIVSIATEVPRGGKLARVRTARVVGVAANTVTGWIGTGLDRPLVYYPARAEETGMRLLARVVGDESHARTRLDADIGSAIAMTPIDEIHTLNDFLAVQRYPFRAFAGVATAIGGIALLLTIAGVYGVLSYLVAQRTREIGIRLALGASIGDVARTVVAQSLVFAMVGVGFGTLLALGASTVMANHIYLVEAFDVPGYAIGIGVILASAVAAAFVPARRAARVDPLDALRAD